MTRFLIAAAIVALLAGVPAYSHHSFSRFYFEDQSISIEGDLASFDLRSPHAWVHVMVPDQNGQMQKYSAEWFNPNRLSRMKVTKDTFKPGDRVIVTGSPSRNVSERTMHLKGIHRPADGWKWGNVR